MERKITEQDYINKIKKIGTKHKFIHIVKQENNNDNSTGLFVCGICSREFEARMYNLGKRCKYCKKDQIKYNEEFYIKRLDEINAEYAFVSLDKTHEGHHHSYRAIFKCKKCNKTFRRTIYKLRKNCPLCSRKNPESKYNIKFCKEWAKQHHLTCLSARYNTFRTKMTWRCLNGHEWNRSLACIFKSDKCPICFPPSYNIQDVKNFAARINFKLLSTAYKSNKESLIWKCPKGHIFKASFNKIKDHGHRCPYCSHRIITLASCQELAKEKNLELLSDTYINTKYKELMNWKCLIHGTIFQQSRRAILYRDYPCPDCYKEYVFISKNEKRLQLLMRQYLSNNLCYYMDTSVRNLPKLIGEHKRALEIDIVIYNRDHTPILGIEWNGIYWHSLPKAQIKDEIKRKYFKSRNIPFLQIVDSIAHDDKGKFVKHIFTQNIKPKLDQISKQYSRTL
tara:strand:+ start:1137 stop:2489 length:1353 start_codon:yes stop_codon:yes gene_type:complete